MTTDETSDEGWVEPICRAPGFRMSPFVFAPVRRSSPPRRLLPNWWARPGRDEVRLC